MNLRPTWATSATALAGGAALAALPPTLGIISVAAVGVAGLALVAPAVALAVVAFTVPVSGLLPLPIGGATATEAAVALVGGAWLAGAAHRRRLGLNGGTAAIPIVLFLGVLTLAAAGAVELTPAVKELAKWAEFGLMVLLTGALVRTPRQAVAVGSLLVLVAAAEAGYGIWQAASGAGPAGFLLGAGHLRASGHFGQPNPFAAYLATALVVAAGALLALSAHRHAGSLRAFIPGLLAASALVIAYGVAASFSRSAAFGLAAAVAVMLAVHDRRLLAVMGALGAAGIALLGLGASGLVPEVIASRFGVVLDNLTLFDPREVTLTSANFPLVQRMAIWQAAWDMFSAHPLLGVGPGNFDTLYRAYAIPGWPQLPGHAHNFYLNLLAEGGIVLFAAYLLLLGWLGGLLLGAIASAKRTLAGGDASADRSVCYGLTLGAVGLLVFLMVHNLFDNLYVHGVLAQVGLIFGLALAAPRCLEAGTQQAAQ